MGALLSRWKAKPSTVEILEKMEKEIQSLEEFQDKNQKLRKTWIRRLILYSLVLYFVTFVIVYVWYLPDGLTERLLTYFLFLLFPVLTWFVRKLLIVWFSKRTEKNNEALEDLKIQKKKILDEVRETETYKAAKLILERFDPEAKIKELELAATDVSNTPRPGQDLRQRTAAQRNISVSTPVNLSQGSPQVPGLLAATPGLQRDTSAPGGPPERIAQQGLQAGLVQRRPGSPATAISGMAIHPPGPPLARPILPRERGALDKVVEYLVGDGPQNRYALICQQCFSHNGMALKEEFEYVAFRCAYCYFLNPARKTRPQAPRLQELSFERRPRTDSQSSTSAMQMVTEDLDSKEPSDSSEKEDSPDTLVAEEIAEEGIQFTKEGTDETEKEDTSTENLAKDIKTPVTGTESEESFMETE